MRLPSSLCSALPLLMLLAVPAAADERVDADLQWKIRQYATEQSTVMETLHVLTDRFGPRLTGSPNFKAAAEWAADELRAMGLDARLEPWDFGHPGWTNERFSMHMTAPVADALVGEVLAWTPGTNGPASGEVVRLTPPAKPTQAEFDAWAAGQRGRLAGRIVFVGEPATVAVSFAVPTKRRDDTELRAQYDPVNPAPSPFAAMARRAAQAQAPEGVLTPQQLNEAIDALLVAERALARVNDAGREHGQVRAFNNRTFDLAKAPPTVVLRNEDYGRIWRLGQRGTPVSLTVDIANRTHPEGATQYNVIADWKGTDKADEIVMLGGHLDSWHAATGATDNAIGVAVMIEAVRVLKALGVTPRRTIRLALWGGEEQGLLGSKAYVQQHLGSFEKPEPGFETFVAYFNLDTGTGRIRGFSVFGPPEAAAVVREATAPFADLGVAGAMATTSRRHGGSDHSSFNAAGLAGIGISVDPIEYGSHTWHTNLDTYERIVPEDTVKSTIVVAAAVHHLASREERLPRFTSETMPKPAGTPEQPAPTPAAPTTPAPTPAPRR